MHETVTTRWFIRTALGNYYATADTEHADTFLATPASVHDGAYAAPTPVTFHCDYIVEQHRREIKVHAAYRHVAAASAVWAVS